MTDAASEKTVYLVRHGQSEANVAPVFQGPESPLSEAGRRQAARVAERVARLSFDALISSPVLRARQTAEIIAQAAGRAVEYSDLFVESVKPTGVHDKPYTDAAAEALWRRWERSLSTPGLRAEDGENYDDLIARVDRALAALAARPERALVVVTHGLTLRLLAARAMLGESLTPGNVKALRTRASTENTGLTVLRYALAFEEGPAWRLWIYNDHAHLG